MLVGVCERVYEVGPAFRAEPHETARHLSADVSLDAERFRGLEVVTGGQRLHRDEDYLAALASRGLDPAPFAGYLEAFRHGMPPRIGFALGLERWLARLAGAASVRETALFARDRNRLTP